jgi:hypothetical protein
MKTRTALETDRRAFVRTSSEQMGATQETSVIKQQDEIAPRLAAMRAAFLRERPPGAEVRINRWRSG